MFCLSLHMMKIKKSDILKANRRGSRDAELINATGWKSIRKVHKSKKTYSRKPKHKKI